MSPRKGLPLFALMLGVWVFASPARAQPGFGRRNPQGGRRPFSTPETPRQTERIRVFDVRHIKGDVTLDIKKGEIRGTVTHTLSPLVPELDTVSLDCASELKVTKVTATPKGKEGKAADCAFKAKGETLVVTLDRLYKPEETIDLAITYSGQPKKGLYFIHPDGSTPNQPECVWTQGESQETRHWLPCYDFPNERATSEMIVTVPKPLTVLSNGSLVDTKENGDGTVTYHWTMDVPHSSYLISLVATEFTVAHDKAGTLPVDYYVLKTVDEATARRAMGKTPRIMEFFQQKIGEPYPYPKYSQAIVPEFTMGGMENISATTLNDYIIGDETSYLELESDGLIAHELAHQWFGDLLTCRDWSQIWLNEGFATYFDALYTEYDRGEDAFRYQMDGNHRGYKGGDLGVRRAMVETRYGSPDDLFDGVTYPKGASVLHALRGLIGDQAWWRGIRSYVAAHKLEVVETGDFKKAMEKASGRDLGWFFDQWVYHGGHPELKASWRYEPDDQTVRLKVEQTQAVDDLTPLFRLPTTAELLDDSGVKNVPIVIDGKTHEFVIPSATKPGAVRIDPKGWWVKDLTFDRPTREWVFLLDHAPDVLGRIDAARALRKLVNDPEAIDALTKAWPRETDRHVRAEMVRLLSEVGGKKAFPALLEAAKDRDAVVRGAAFRALADLDADPKSEALFRAAWADKKEAYGVRRSALTGLSKWKVKDREALLKAALEIPSDKHSLAAAALDAMLRDDTPASRENAVLYSKPGRPAALRRTAIAALGRLAKDDPQVASALAELVNDPHRYARFAAWRAVAQGQVKSALPGLEARLDRESGSSKQFLETTIATVRSGGRRPTPRPAVVTAAPSDSKAEVADLERQATDLELQIKELRNKAEALKLKDERAKLGTSR